MDWKTVKIRAITLDFMEHTPDEEERKTGKVHKYCLSSIKNYSEDRI